MTTSVVESQSARPQRLDVSPAEPADSAWTPLYRVGGVAALLAVAIIPLAVIVFLAWPPPTTVESWFALFQRNGFLGLLDLDLLMMTSYVVLIPLYLALYVALRRVSQSFMAIALAFNLLGTALVLAVNPAAAMLTLSDRYATATTDAQRTVFLGAGQALISELVRDRVRSGVPAWWDRHPDHRDRHAAEHDLQQVHRLHRPGDGSDDAGSRVSRNRGPAALARLPRAHGDLAPPGRSTALPTGGATTGVRYATTTHHRCNEQSGAR